MAVAPWVALGLLALVLLVVGAQLRQARRADFIRSYAFPKGLLDSLRAQHPALSAKDGELAARALRQFFLAYLKGGRRYVSMPSQVADDLWHAFIVYTRHYELFCRRAFGRFLHHTPAVVLGGSRQGNEGLRRVWWHCCREENIDPAHATRLPLLFAIDAKLGIANGFHYLPDCTRLRAVGGEGTVGGAVYCGGDFSSAGIDGGTDGFGDGSGDGGADGGGDGGGGD